MLRGVEMIYQHFPLENYQQVMEIGAILPKKIDMEHLVPSLVKKEPYKVGPKTSWK